MDRARLPFPVKCFLKTYEARRDTTCSRHVRSMIRTNDTSSSFRVNGGYKTVLAVYTALVIKEVPRHDNCEYNDVPAGVLINDVNNRTNGKR